MPKADIEVHPVSIRFAPESGHFPELASDTMVCLGASNSPRFTQTATLA
jgi:hypothetical protein